MDRIIVNTKPNGPRRSWLEVGEFKTDQFDRKMWAKDRTPDQDSRLDVNRDYSGYAGGQTIDWIISIPDDYPLTIIKVNFDRLNPKEYEVIWEPEAKAVDEREAKIQRAFELAKGNSELTSLLEELLKKD
jgi:hypothetical protein